MESQRIKERRKVLKGKPTYDIYLKPSKLTCWVILEETKNCLKVGKVFPLRYGRKNYPSEILYIPKSRITKITKNKATTNRR